MHEVGHDDPRALRELAVELARSGGRLAVTRRAEGFSVASKSTATDLVTDADAAVESFLRAELGRRRPADSVLGEEQGASSDADTEYRWVVDPIDGTVNFMLGLPLYTVSVAVQHHGDTVAGCVYNPVTDETFSAARGHGAECDGVPLTGPRSVPLAEAIFGTGFGYDAQARRRQARIAAEMVGHTGNLRRLGSAAQDLCFIAAGRLDLYYEAGLNEWDYAAGLLIAQEAGCVVSGLDGAPPGRAMVAVAGPELAAEFFDLLTDLHR